MDPAAGCYRIELGPWSPELQPVDAPYQIPPARFRLHTRLGEDAYERGKRIVRPVIPRGRTPSAYWERIGEDSVQIAWTNGFVGAWLRLRAAGDSLRGTARAFTDGGGQRVPEAAVRGRRIDCAEVSVWIEKWPPEGQSESRFYDVLGDDGQLRTRVVLRAPLTRDPPPFFGARYVVGVVREADTDVDRVVRFTVSGEAAFRRFGR